MYELNKYGKIVVQGIEVYYGCVVETDSQAGIAKIYVCDWRDRKSNQKTFKQIILPQRDFIIKYEVEQ